MLLNLFQLTKPKLHVSFLLEMRARACAKHACIHTNTHTTMPLLSNMSMTDVAMLYLVLPE